MNSQVTAFFAKAETDTALQQQISVLATETDRQAFINQMTVLAAEHGYTFTSEEFDTSVSELADQHLAEVTGGVFEPPKIIDFSPDEPVSHRPSLKKWLAEVTSAIVPRKTTKPNP